jgi:tellurite resistance protein
VQASITPQIAEALRTAHPARAQRLALSDRNPWMSWVEPAAKAISNARAAEPASHPFRQFEQLWSESVEQGLDLMRDMRDACYETMFYGIYSSPMMKIVGRAYNFQRTLKDPSELRFLPEVQAHLLNVARGGFVEAVIRMLIVLAQARGSVRRTRLERSAQVLTMHEPFASLGSERRATLIQEQTVIVEFEPEAAVQALPGLLLTEKDRREAVDVVEFIAGPLEEMEPHTIQALQRFRRILGLPTLEARPTEATAKPSSEPEAA